jgi:gliding motility-associated-like protein
MFLIKSIKLRNTLFAILFLLSAPAFAINTAEQIEINYVNVNNAAGSVTIDWKPYSNPAEINGYIIYKYVNGLLNPIFVGNVTKWTFSYPEVNTEPVKFAIVAYTGTPANVIDRTAYKEYHQTIYTQLQYDSCASVINIKWTKYLGWGNSVAGYKIFNAATGLQQGAVSASDTTFAISGIKAKQTYSFYVLASHTNGTYTSKSNVANIYTETLSGPGYINVRNVEVSQNSSCKITFYVDPTTELHNYRLVRSLSPTGGFTVVDNYTNHLPNNLIATDASIGDSTMYYKLQVLNNCGSVTNASNLATLIAPRYALTGGQQVNLSWKNYQSWPYGIREYRIFRSIGSDVPQQIGTTSATQFSDDLTSLLGQQLSGNICYYIETASNPDGTGNLYKATSLSVCVDVASQIFIPQAFTPNGDGQNDEFKPSFAFLPADYTMIVYNRYGSKVFETTIIGKGWNGVVKGGVKAPEGTYVYFISFTTSSGNRIEKRGSLTLIYP